MSGKTDVVKGSVKEATDGPTGNDKLPAEEEKADQEVGEVKQAVAKVGDKVKAALKWARGSETGVTMADRWQSLRRRLWQVVKYVALAAVVGGFVYWFKFAPVSVSMHQAERGDIVAEVMGTGTLEAHFKSTISPRIAGRLQEVLAD